MKLNGMEIVDVPQSGYYLPVILNGQVKAIIPTEADEEKNIARVKLRDNTTMTYILSHGEDT